ncbi:MAG: metallophosphoesterase family protein [Ardenticatenaceae bacterium]|nr:metallophosphoesterase family protein [Ardenticatenaceae bacterium]
MRIALISDVHGNLIALEAVLADIAQAGVDQIIFLGDLVTFGPQPREAVERVQALGCPCVLGNHDDFVLARERVPHLGWVSEWFAAQLTAVHLNFLRTFQPAIRVPLDAAGHTLLCCHGSPRSYNENLLATTAPEVLDEIVDAQTSEVSKTSEVLVAIACGHTHVPLIRRHQDLLIVNVGSVGMPFAEMPFAGHPVVMPWAEYGIVAWRNGRLTAELRRLPLDTEPIKKLYRASGLPDMDYFVERWSVWRGR